MAGTFPTLRSSLSTNTGCTDESISLGTEIITTALKTLDGDHALLYHTKQDSQKKKKKTNVSSLANQSPVLIKHSMTHY